MNKIILGDCLKAMYKIEDNSIDMILCDMPYGHGMTACKWDVAIDLNKMWDHYKRIIKNNGAIVLTASQPFTTVLISSNIKMFKYCWVWNKFKSGNFTFAKSQPLRVTEDIVIFNSKRYNPQMTKVKKENMRIRDIKNHAMDKNGTQGIGRSKTSKERNEKLRFPVNLINIKSTKGACNSINRIHPTQKPVELFEYLIKTYTNKGDLVLDNCAGSGTTGIACLNLKRKFILIEKDKKYYEVMKKRLKNHMRMNENTNNI